MGEKGVHQFSHQQIFHPINVGALLLALITYWFWYSVIPIVTGKPRQPFIPCFVVPLRPIGGPTRRYTELEEPVSNRAPQICLRNAVRVDLNACPPLFVDS